MYTNLPHRTPKVVCYAVTAVYELKCSLQKRLTVIDYLTGK